MNRVSEGVRAFFYDKQRKGARSAAAVMLAVLVMLSVVGGLIRPAASLGGDTSPMVIGSSSTGTGVYLVSASATNKSGQVVSKIDGETTKYESFLSLKLKLTEADANLLRTDPQYGSQISFQLFPVEGGVVQRPEGFDIALDGQDLTKVYGTVVSTDDEGSNIGEYVIDFENNVGIVTFNFDAPYFKKHQGQQQGIGAGLTFEAWCWNLDNSTNDKTVNLFGHDVTIPLNRAINHADIEVNKSYNNDFFYETPGETMQNRRCLGSSFTIHIQSHNGIEGDEITVTDELVSNNVHFDRPEGYIEQLDENTTLEIIQIKNTDSGQKLIAKIRSTDPDAFKTGFNYDWRCPVAVNQEYLTSDGSAVDLNELEIISGHNNVKVRTNDTDPIESDDSADIQVNLVADIAKYAGEYDEAANKIHWKYTIYKDNGWWQNGRIVVEDMFNDETGNHTVKPSVSNVQIQAVPVFPGTDLSGVTIAYNSTDSEFVIDMPTESWEGKLYSKDQIKEFIVTYDTDVTPEDYGTTQNNWVGLKNPVEGYTDEDTQPGDIPKPSVQKTGIYDPVNKTITWTIIVSNPHNQKLDGLTLDDTLTWTGGTPSQIDLSQASIVGSASGNINDKLSISGNTLTFNNDVSVTDPMITISYTQQIDLDDSKGTDYKNKTTLKAGEKELGSDEDNIHVPDAFELIKESTFTSDGALGYTVTVRNEYGDEIGRTVITDTLAVYNNSNAQAVSEMTVTVPGGTQVSSIAALTDRDSASGLLYYIDTSSGPATICFAYNGSKTDDLTVNYFVSPADGSDIKSKQGYRFNNTVRWNELEKNVDTTIPDSFTVLESKNYTYDQNTNLVTWTVTVSNDYGLDLGKYYSGGDTTHPVPVYDTKFGTGEVRSFKVFDINGTDVTAPGDLEAVNGSARTTVESKECGCYFFKEGMNSKRYTLVYTTEYTAYAQGGQMDQNDVWYDNQHKYAPIYYVGTRADIYKSKYNSSDVDDDGNVQTRWSARVRTYKGGFLENPITDSMSAEFFDTSSNTYSQMDGVEHYMTADQFDIDRFSFTFYNIDGQQIAVSDPSALFYLAKTSGTDNKVTGFEIRARELEENSPEYELLSEIAELEVLYTTTEAGVGKLYEVSEEDEDPVMDIGDKLVYKNTGGFAGRTSTPDDTREKRTAVTKCDGKYNYNRADPTVYEVDELEADENYYYLKYRIDVNNYSVYTASENITATDTMPPDFEFVSGKYSAQIPGQWGFEMTEGSMDDALDSTACRYSSSGRKVSFYIPGGVHQGGLVQIEYTIRISKEKLELALDDPDNVRIDKARFENKVEVGDSFDSQPVVINNSSGVLGKAGQDISTYDGDNKVLENKVSYTLDINPKGLDLGVDTDYLRLTDTINKSEYSEEAICPILFNNLTGSSIKVYKVTGSGADETVEELDCELYKMSAPVKQSLPVRGGSLGNGDVYTFAMELPDETHIRIIYDYLFIFNDEARVKEDYDSANLELKNSAVIDGDIANQENRTKMVKANKNTHSGYAYTYAHFSLRKVSADNWKYGLENAEFILARIDSSGNVEYATDVFETNEDVWFKDQQNQDAKASVKLAVFSSAGEPMKFVTGENGIVELPSFQVLKDGIHDNEPVKILQYDLDDDYKQKYVYLLKEVKSPSGYYLSDETANYYFYERNSENCAPADAIEKMIELGMIGSEDDVKAHDSFSTIELKNDRMELEVWKNWEDKDAEGRPDEITVQLWQSDLPNQDDSFHTVTINYSNNKNTDIETKRYSVTDGAVLQIEISDSGKGLYSAETSQPNLTISGTQYPEDRNYLTVSTSQITSDAEFDIKLNTNNDPQTIEKNVISEITPRSDPGFDPNSATPIGEPVKVKASHGWRYKFDTSQLDSTKYYFVTETVPEGYMASYTVNGIRNGTFELSNIALKTGSIVINKQWFGDDSSGIDSAAFTVYGYETSEVQPESDYHKEQNTAVLNFTLTDQQDPTKNLSKTYKVQKGVTYYITPTGRPFQRHEARAFVNGTELNLYYGDGEEVGDVVKFKIAADRINSDNEFNVNVTINRYQSMTGNYVIICEDSNGAAIAEYDPHAGGDTEFGAAQVILPDSGDALVCETITVTAEDGWTGTLKRLPLWADNDQSRPIYYYVVENASGKYIPLNYSNNSFTLSETEENQVTVINKRENVQEYELPESGGEGTALYFLAGGTATLLAAAIYIRKRRAAA